MRGRFACAAIAAASVIASACSFGSQASSGGALVISATTTAQDSGILDALVAAYERTVPGLKIKALASGSGEAIELGRRGDADVLLVHSPALELRFVEEGLGQGRAPVMSNRFIIAGPSEDRAGVGRVDDPTGAFRQIASSAQPFVSRADRSGTHEREKDLWERAGAQPRGDWYVESGQAAAETLVIASERGAYTLTDSSTFTAVKRLVELEILLDEPGRPDMLNEYHVIVVNRSRRLEQARDFARWITGGTGQQLIEGFGAQRYGAPLFTAARVAQER